MIKSLNNCEICLCGVWNPVPYCVLLDYSHTAPCWLCCVINTFSLSLENWLTEKSQCFFPNKGRANVYRRTEEFNSVLFHTWQPKELTASLRRHIPPHTETIKKVFQAAQSRNVPPSYDWIDATNQSGQFCTAVSQWSTCTNTSPFSYLLVTSKSKELWV